MKTLTLTAAVLASFSCAHQYGGRATVLEEGRAQVAPAFELSLISARTGRDQSPAAPWVQAGVGYHVGLGSRTEVGARVFGAGWPTVGGQLGAAFDLKVQLYRSEDRERGWDLAVALSPSYHFAMQGDQPFHLFGFTAPLLIGKNLGPHQLVMGVRIADWLLTSYGQRPLNTLWVGTSLGIAFRVRRVELMPELGLLYSPIQFNGESHDPERRGVSIITLGLSMPIDLT